MEIIKDLVGEILPDDDTGIWMFAGHTDTICSRLRPTLA